MNGMVLLAHGARDARWAEPFEAIAAQVRAGAPQAEVTLAFLEFMSPGLMQALEDLAGRGCTRLAVLPLFLGAGGHVRRDVPEVLARFGDAHPALVPTLLPAIGEDARVIAAMAQAATAHIA